MKFSAEYERFYLNPPPHLEEFFGIQAVDLARNLIFLALMPKEIESEFFYSHLRVNFGKMRFFQLSKRVGEFSVIFPKISFLADIRKVFSRGWEEFRLFISTIQPLSLELSLE